MAGNDTRTIFRDPNAHDFILIYGVGHNGQKRHIDEVPRGRACGCKCPACSSPLIARQGDVMVHHFAHDAGTNCQYAPESALHLICKDLLLSGRKLLLPDHTVKERGLEALAIRERTMTFDTVVLENRLEGIVPDVIASVKDHTLIIEVAVTHFCDKAKIEKIRKLGIAAIEIDMSGFKSWSEPDKIAEALIHGAPREWLFNSRIDTAAAELRQRTAERDTRRRQQLESEIARLTVLVQILKEQHSRRNDHDLIPAEALEAGIEHIIGIEVPGDYIITALRATWQSWVVQTFLKFADRTDFQWPLDRIVSSLTKKGWLSTDIDEGAIRAYQSAIAAQLPEFQTATSVVESYLAELVKRRVLEMPYVGGGYRVNPNWHNTAHSPRWHRNAETRKDLEKLEEVFTSAMAEERGRRIAYPHFGRDDLALDFATWMATPLTAFGRSPREITFSGSLQERRALFDAVDNVSALVTWDRPVNDLIGLPLKCLQFKAEENAARKQAERIEYQSQQRAGRLLRAMEEEVSQSAAFQWLDAAHLKLSGETPRTRSRHSEEGLTETLELVAIDGPVISHREAVEAAQRDRQREIDRKASPYRESFRQEAQKKARHGAVEWINVVNRQLENHRPIDYVVDLQTYNIALRLMPGMKPRSQGFL